MAVNVNILTAVLGAPVGNSTCFIRLLVSHDAVLFGSLSLRDISHKPVRPLSNTDINGGRSTSENE